jgi:16S rRNA (cytosine967-C5)-methyltransferase
MTSSRAVAFRALLQLEQGRCQRVREALERGFRAPGERLPPRDMAFAWELAHGVVRNERWLDAILATFAHRGLPRDPGLLCAIRLGAHQLLMVPGMPAHAAVHETVALLHRNQAFANAMLRAIARNLVDRAADQARSATEVPISPTRTLVLPAPGLAPAFAAHDPLAIRHSLPDWLVARWRKAHGDRVQSICEACSAIPHVFLRATEHAGSAAHLAEQLAVDGVRTEPASHPAVLQWSGGESPFSSRAWREGWCVVQDPTAVRAAEALGVAPGETVVDLCAAPGTKTMLLAERAGPTGHVHAHDVDPARCQRIRENVARLHFEPRVTVTTDAATLPRADAVLADVPCSNSGVLGRRVEVRHRLTEQAIRDLTAVQRTLLEQAISLAKPGGRVAYSTCSIEPEEDGDLVRSVLRPGLALVSEQLTLPVAGSCDGGYVAVLQVGAPA